MMYSGAKLIGLHFLTGLVNVLRLTPYILHNNEKLPSPSLGILLRQSLFQPAT